jgi:preprotein translocase subunit SecG
MRDILVAILILDSLALIGLILLQHGKGADAGAAFGSGGGGGSESLFGSRGSATFLSRLTALFAVIFFAVTLALAVLSAKRVDTPRSVTETAPVEQSQPAQPAAGATAPKPDVPEIPK